MSCLYCLAVPSERPSFTLSLGDSGSKKEGGNPLRYMQLRSRGTEWMVDYSNKALSQYHCVAFVAQLSVAKNALHGNLIHS
jgi:hypothetical protein